MYGNDTEWENGFQRTLRKLLLKILSRLHQSQHLPAAKKGLISAKISSKTAFPDFIEQSYNTAVLKDGKAKASPAGYWAQSCYCGTVLVVGFAGDMARDRLTPTFQCVIQISWTGLSLPSQLQPTLVQKILRQLMNLPKSLLFAIQTHQKAISHSLSASKGSSLQNSGCQIMLPIKSCSQAVPSGGLTERDSTQVPNTLRRAGIGPSF